MTTDQKTLKDLLCHLADSGIPFVVVGGYAATMHGSSMVTEDLDVCAVLSPENITKLREVLAPFHPVHRITPQKLPLLDHPRELAGVNNLYLSTDLGHLDLLGSVGGVGDFERVAQGAVEVTLFGHRCKVISLDDLIAAKLFMKRPHDLETVKQLEWIKRRGSGS